MPVTLSSKLPSESAEARIEIIPLIDIMFFLLAAFMLVSLSMVNLRGVKVNLPVAATASAGVRKDVVDVTVDKAGLIYLNKETRPIGDDELVRALESDARSNSDLHVFISGDRDARHGDVIHALDLVRSAGIDTVAFEIRPGDESHP